MTLNTMGRRAAKATIASIVSVAMGLGLTACSNDYTVAYLYVTTANANPGLINGYKVDYQSGTLTLLADSPIPSGGRNPVTIVARQTACSSTPSTATTHPWSSSPSVQTASSIPRPPTTSPAALPRRRPSIAAGKFLYVTFTYQNNPDGSQLYTPANPGPGGIIDLLPSTADGSLGTAHYPRRKTRTLAATRSASTAHEQYVYVIEQDAAIDEQSPRLLR